MGCGLRADSPSMRLALRRKATGRYQPATSICLSPLDINNMFSTQRVQVPHADGFWGVKRGLSTSLKGTWTLWVVINALFTQRGT